MTAQEFDDRYELRVGGPVLLPDGTPDQTTIDHIQAIRLGFHNPEAEITTLANSVAGHLADHEVDFDVYRRNPMPGSMDERSPVGTFGAVPKALSWGDGSSVDTFAILGVTVRPTDRRRGILRHMMTSALDWAVENGLPMAALTASEGTIYRRFGFGPAIRERRILVKTARALPLLVPTSGEVVVVPPSFLRDGRARAVFDRFHARTLGSMVRNTGTWGHLLGLDNAGKEPDRSVRTAIHRTGDDIDGYVSYRVHEADGQPTRIAVLDLIAVDEPAYLALWEYLLSVDLVDEVEYPFARMDDPIVHVLADNRASDIEHEEDHVWLRVLDVPALLSSRPYAVDGTVTFTVSDAMGYAAGTWELTVLEGRGRVRQVASDVDGATSAALSLDVATLSALLLGAVNPVVLHDVGLISGDAAAAELLAAMLRPARQPHGMTYF